MILVPKVKLAVEHLTKKFGDLIAVNDVSFDVKVKELLTLLGPSGCGKTTTLRCIVGLTKPDEGNIHIDGKLVNDVPPQKRGLGLVFQDYAVFPHMSVYDNIAFGLKIRKVPQPEVDEKVKEMANLLGIESILSKKAGGVSLSEKQSVAIGRCLVVKPEIFLLDEPLSIVDAKVRERMRNELKRIQQEVGITTVYVTHDQLEAMMLSDRIAIMKDGKLLQLGTPEEIYDNPQTLFTAGFIGSPGMNLLTGTLRKKDDKLLFKMSEDKTLVDITGLVEEALKGKMVLGIRPEDIRISPTRPDKASIKGILDLVEATGHKVIYHVKVGEEIIKVKERMKSDLNVKKEVWLTLPKEKMHIFDKKTERKMSHLPTKVKEAE